MLGRFPSTASTSVPRNATRQPFEEEHNQIHKTATKVTNQKSRKGKSSAGQKQEQETPTVHPDDADDLFEVQSDAQRHAVQKLAKVVKVQLSIRLGVRLFRKESILDLDVDLGDDVGVKGPLQRLVHQLHTLQQTHRQANTQQNAG
jgi:hypothetical protein